MSSEYENDRCTHKSLQAAILEPVLAESTSSSSPALVFLQDDASYPAACETVFLLCIHITTPHTHTHTLPIIINY